MSERELKSPSCFRINLAPGELSEEEKRKAQEGAAVQRHPLDGVACRIGDASCAMGHQAALKRSAATDHVGTGRALLRLQRTFGNQYVRQVVSPAGDGAVPEAGPAVEAAIQSRRGGGQGLDSDVRQSMESHFQADFSNVRVHHDTHSDSLNRELQARAFTTGQDIFFSKGAYRPGTASGKELLAHELTHVVQQNGSGIQAKMTVSNPGDVLEREADSIAKAVMQSEQRSGDPGLQRQPEEEEKETK